VALLPLTRDEVSVAGGIVARRLEVEAPFGGKAAVVARLSASGELSSSEAKRLAAELFAAAESEARAVIVRFGLLR